MNDLYPRMRVEVDAAGEVYRLEIDTRDCHRVDKYRVTYDARALASRVAFSVDRFVRKALLQEDVNDDQD